MAVAARRGVRWPPRDIPRRSPRPPLGPGARPLGLLPCPGTHRGQLRPGGAERSI